MRFLEKILYIIKKKVHKPLHLLFDFSVGDELWAEWTTGLTHCGRSYL